MTEEKRLKANQLRRTIETIEGDIDFFESQIKKDNERKKPPQPLCPDFIDDSMSITIRAYNKQILNDLNDSLEQYKDYFNRL